MKNRLSRLLALIIAGLSLISCTSATTNGNVQVINGQFVDAAGAPQYYIGTNMWYAGRLAATKEGMARLEKELDYLKDLGVTNLRILATEGEDLDALELALKQMDKRGMKAVVFMNNAWEWSYGFAEYLERTPAGKQPRPATDGYWPYMQAMAAFHTNAEAVKLNQEYVAKVVSRFKGNNAIFSWQLCNEPRCFSSNPANKDAFINYIQSTARLIKSIDPDHMVSTGNEGLMGCEEDMELAYRVNDCADVDYITIHIWPYNWSWVSEDGIADMVDGAIEKVGGYIDAHLQRMADLNKPMVIEEFGYPRDGFQFAQGTSTVGRDALYDYVSTRVVENQARGGRLAGANFWAWGGFADNAHEWWQEGDDYCGDPSQEQQGLNSVFISDESTIAVIRKATDALAGNAHVSVALQHNWIFDDANSTLAIDTWGKKGMDIDVRLDLVSDRSLMLENETVYSRTISVRAGKQAIFDLNALAPGFYQARVSYTSADCNGAIPSFNIGVKPLEIESPVDVDQAEFDAFWADNLAELAKVPMNVKMTKDAEHSNDIRTTYRVEMKSLGGVTIGGILCTPVKEGRYPVYLDYMGYGAQPFFYDPSAAPDRIQFLVSVRGQGIFREEAQRWIDRGLDSRENFYYRGAYCDVVRAIDFVCSLPDADLTKIYAQGESQGGAFTFVAAALDKRICAAAPAVPFMSDFCDYWKIVSWPVWEVFEAAQKQGLSREHVLDLLRWFDIKNFAGRISCPLKMAFGLQDPTCPPHTNFAAYNMVKGPKSWYVAPYCGHAMWKVQEWSRIREDFFASQQKELLASLKETAASGKFLYCHQDDLMYGHTWHLEGNEKEFNRSDIFDVCGEYPAMLGYDLGGIEIGDECNLDGNNFEQMRLAAQQFHAKGGVVTVSWHPRNPLTGGDAWDVSSNKVVESILPGGSRHEEFMIWLQRVADYLESYGFPVVFRPWHENSGSWFWWGAKLCTAEQFKQLWIMTYDYFVNERGLRDLVWAYSPNGVADRDTYLKTYPGDRYVDVMGFDLYHFPGMNFVQSMQQQLEILEPLAQEHGKVVAVSETGSEGIPDPKWWTEKLLPAVEGHNIAYLLTWRNAWDKEGHFYGPWKGAACEADFMEFYKNERTIFLK